MKIKRKVEMNLPQLIEWSWENDVRCRTFIANDKHIPGKVNFDENGMVDIQTTVGNDETFTVEVETEITEDTKSPLIERFIGAMGYACYTSHGNLSINDVFKRNSADINPTHFYIENDERELILIWRDGRLIE